MDFKIKNLGANIVNIARQIGYVIIDTRPNGEYNLVRRLTGINYPRFHIYLKAASAKASASQGNFDYIFSLHLDQKKPVYQGAHAHSGEYFGPVIDGESDRIKSILQ